MDAAHIRVYNRMTAANPSIKASGIAQCDVESASETDSDTDRQSEDGDQQSQLLAALPANVYI